MAERTEFTVTCAGGCGRILTTNNLVVFWTAPLMCPDCTEPATASEPAGQEGDR